MLFVASASPRRSRVAYLVAALVSSRACWRVVRAGRSLGPRWRTHHMRTPRATQMARSSISEQPGRSEPDVLACQVLTRHSRRESQASKVDGGGAQVSGRGERRLPSTGGVASCHEKAVDLTAGRRARCRCVLVARRGGATLRGRGAWAAGSEYSSYRAPSPPLVQPHRPPRGSGAITRDGGVYRVSK